MSLRQNPTFTNRLQIQQQSSTQSTASQQFQTWNSERNAFNRDADVAKREREKLEQQVREIREHQKQVKENIDIATDQLGGLHRDRQMLAATRMRLQETLAKERVELEECAHEIEQVCSDEHNQKKTFHAEMGQFNGELGDLLRKGREYRLQQMISVETVPIILGHHKQQLDNENVSPESKTDYVAVLTEIEQAAHSLMEKTNMYIESAAKRQKAESTLNDCRSSVMMLAQGGSLPSQFLTLANLEELEAKWGDNEEGADDLAGEGSNPMIPEAALATNNPVHLQIFYDDDAPSPAPAILEDQE